eukprot:XP_003726244.1 PREDICTED: N-acetylgalactosaminyltransferase 7 [Strongylocentrotus purpuratus]
MATSLFGGGRMSSSSRSRHGLKVGLVVILVVGLAPILISLNSGSASSSSSSSSAAMGGHGMGPMGAWGMRDDSGKTREKGMDAVIAEQKGGSMVTLEKNKDIQGNNRHLNTNQHPRHRTLDQSQSTQRSRDIHPPVLKETTGNYEPPRQPYRTGPGEYGLGVLLDHNEKHLYDKAFEEYGFNMVVSDRISLDRIVADLRDKECKHWHYPTNLPNTSVVIVFHQEGWSTLIRTIHSVFNTSPKELLAEVLLVDDYSDKVHLKKKLDDYIRDPRFSGKIRIVRNKKREGLIRSRTIGARKAIGQVLTFLDAHCECGPNWLPPLLAEIAVDRSTIVCPTVDAISSDTFAYTSQGDGLCRGAFDWDFWYKRIPVKPYWHRLGLKQRSQPYPSPVMAGGLLALDRSYFFELGGYDPGLQIWGGENFEISFKVWMCGGSLKFVPCSRVGHVYRKQVPYSYPSSGVEGVSVVDLNYMRVAEVWLDEYKDSFYATKPLLEGKPCGNISEQVEYRKQNCPKSFKWFMEEIAFDNLQEYPPPAKNKIWGEIRSVDSELCLDTNGAQNDPTHATMGMEGCHGMGGNQLFRINTRGQLVVEDGFCLYARPNTEKLIFAKCTAEKSFTSETTMWDYDSDRQIIHLERRKRCLDHNQETSKVFVTPCQHGEISQQFKFYKEEIR